MTVKVQKSLFAQERSQRFNTALKVYPTARRLEILPFLCFFAREEVRNWHVVDLASGGGYLGRMFESVAKKVTYLDESPNMLKNIKSDNTLVGDIRHASESIGEGQADMAACLASFHHLHVPDVKEIKQSNITYNGHKTRQWTPERYLNVELSRQLQDSALNDWYRMLKPEGWLALIDVPGYPDDAWNEFWTDREPYTINTRGYYEHLLLRLTALPLQTDLEVLRRFFSDEWRMLWEKDPQIQVMRRLMKNGAKRTMKDLLESYQLPLDMLKKKAPMVPTDFFDDVIDNLSIQRHFSYFPRETDIGNALRKIGMSHIFTGTLPTPWIFDSREDAIWFVHELFGFGKTWPRDAIPPQELKELGALLDKYLGLHEDSFGRTLLFWQLSYFIARK